MTIADLGRHSAFGNEIENPDVDYQSWVEEKILRALKQADDPAQMIPADKVWKDLGLEI